MEGGSGFDGATMKRWRSSAVRRPRPKGGPAADQRDNTISSPPSPSTSSSSGPRRLLVTSDENAAGVYGASGGGSSFSMPHCRSPPPRGASGYVPRPRAVEPGWPRVAATLLSLRGNVSFDLGRWQAGDGEAEDPERVAETEP